MNALGIVFAIGFEIFAVVGFIGSLKKSQEDHEADDQDQ